MFIDGRSYATRPARLTVHWPTFLRHHPTWLRACLLGAIVSGALIWWQLGFYAGLLGLAVAILFLVYVRYVRARFHGGALCPAMVLCEDPFLVGVSTDLASGDGPARMVVKVFRPSKPSAASMAEPRLAAVCLYSGETPAGHWNDCHPDLVLSANASETLHRTLLERIPKTEWAQLEIACQDLPRPLRCGLYAVRGAVEDSL